VLKVYSWKGNLQLSPRVIKKIGIENIIVISTPSKLASISYLRVDSGDKTLDHLFSEKGYMMVVVGYRLSRFLRFKPITFILFIVSPETLKELC